MRENGSRTEDMVMGGAFSITKTYMWGSGLKGKDMARVLISQVMERDMRVSGEMT